MRIGIDIGNVIIGGGGEDTSFFGENFLKTPELLGSYSTIANLADDGHELHIISKCGVMTELKSVRWLEDRGYFWMIPQQRVHFVRKRGLKAPMAMSLELDIFIDDRQDVIDWMQGVVKYPILFTSWEQTNKELERIFNEQA
jgi:hypothetical protein